MIRFTTQSGSVYEVDYDAKCWARLKVTSKSGPVRADTARFINNPVVKLGQRVAFWCEPITPGSILRLVDTSPVTQMEEFDGYYCDDEALPSDPINGDNGG